MTYKKLLFASPGIPKTAQGKGTIKGMEKIKELGLDAMEIEFVRNVYMKEGMAEKVREKAEALDLELTCHGPYWVNLNSTEKEKIEASKKRIMKTAKIADIAGAKSVVFHMAFYGKNSPEEAYETVKKNLQEIMEQIRNSGNKITIRAELMGNHSKFGTLNEIIKLSKEVKGVAPCIDYAHVVARSNGKKNNYAAFSTILSKIKKELGEKALKNMHIHAAGVEYSDKGEKRHINLEDSEVNYKDIVKSWKDYNIRGVVVSESPNQEKDALLLKREYNG